MADEPTTPPIDALADFVMARIRDDFGTTGITLFPDFSSLHDVVDANEYLIELDDDFGLNAIDIESPRFEILNQVADEVSARLAKTARHRITVADVAPAPATGVPPARRIMVHLARSEAQGEPVSETIGPFDYVQVTYDTLECCKDSDAGSQFTTFHIDGGGGMWYPQRLEPIGDSQWQSSGPDLTHHGWTDITIHPADLPPVDGGRAG